jgi:hypothetical protein
VSWKRLARRLSSQSRFLRPEGPCLADFDGLSRHHVTRLASGTAGAIGSLATRIPRWGQSVAAAGQFEQEEPGAADQSAAQSLCRANRPTDRGRTTWTGASEE